MTKIINLDFSTGASGDKLTGAFLDLCLQTHRIDEQRFQDLFRAILPQVKVDLTYVGTPAAFHLEVTEPDPPHRNYLVLKELIASAQAPLKTIMGSATGSSDASASPAPTTADAAPLPPAPAALAVSSSIAQRTVKLALSALELLAQAESEVHGVPLDQVHFHEVGAADTVVDFLGCALLYTLLGSPQLYASPLAIGSGTVNCAHGVLPVPAPATAKLLSGLQTTLGDFAIELTTPTGAALLQVLEPHFCRPPAFTFQAIGYGAGSAILSTPNVIQAIWGEPTAIPITLLETNLDHITSEQAGYAAEQLIADPRTLDVWQEPIVMKKQRLATKLCVLVAATDAASISAQISQLTGSLGIRSSAAWRATAERCQEIRDTPYGPVRFKLSPYTARPEADDVSRIATTYDLPWSQVYQTLMNKGA
jgi:uncharacterized protein (TIGR00299 family) protein